MFLCEDCTHPDDKWLHNLSMGISRGPCEVCGYEDYCIDGKRVDPNWKENVEKTIAKYKDNK